MNDPGIDGPIGEAAQDVEKDPFQDQQTREEQEEQDFLDPSRWWFASTACPLIAGTFGPMANAFSICALVQNWRVQIPQGSDEAHGTPIQDPKWLLAINGIQLGCALIANLALLLNMARRISFAIAQPITIIGWFMSALLLISLVSVASSSYLLLQPRYEFAHSQGYYYAIIAASIYCIISGLMVLTVVGAHRGHYPKEFRLTASQRTLMLQTISFMVYLLLGALIWSKIEGWNYLDALYWADFTLLTVGIGDFAPTTRLGRGLLLPFAIGGIVMIGLVIGSIRSLVLERGKRKIKARFTEKRRESVVATADFDNRTIKTGWFKRVQFSQKSLTETQRRKQEFLIMRKIQKDSESRRRWIALSVSSAAAAALALLGAVVFWQSEGRPQGWTYFEAFYFSFVSLLTIGYGDISPISNAGKAFFVFWSLLAVPTLTILISDMGDTVVRGFRDLTIWIGAITVLPGEGGARNTIKANMSKLRSLLRSDDFQLQQPPGLLPQKEHDGSNKLADVYFDRLTAFVREEELKEADEAGERGDEVMRDIHFYNYVLANEIRNVMKDVKISPPREYTYAEWAYFLKLIGQNEYDETKHGRPPAKKDLQGKHRHGLGAAAMNEPGVQWSWLGIRSPLMSNMDESEWILENLTAALERQLRTVRASSAQQDLQPPPISMSDLTRRRTNGTNALLDNSVVGDKSS